VERPTPRWLAIVVTDSTGFRRARATARVSGSTTTGRPPYAAAATPAVAFGDQVAFQRSAAIRKSIFSAIAVAWGRWVQA